MAASKRNKPATPPSPVVANQKKIMAFIAQSTDIERLGSLVRNARAKGAVELADTAFRKLVSLVPAEKLGTVEHDFWQTVQAFEFTLSEERGKTTRLSRTRQKVAKVGAVQILAEWATDSHPTDGFKKLVERGMPELTGEAVALRHADRFAAPVLEAARRRLSEAGVDVATLS
jgi:hypothetical protein